MAAKFKIFKSYNNNNYYFRLVTFSDKILMTSEGYSTKPACLNGIDSVKMNSKNRNRFNLLQARNGKFYFNLIASNGQVIGTSEFFSSRSAMEKTLEMVRADAEFAETLDLTLTY